MGLICSQTDWVSAKSKGDFVGVLAFDLSAAFDTINSTKLIKKLQHAGVKGRPLQWIKSYMSGRKQSVLWNDSMSNSCPLTHGVPQGSILGPLLFLVMIADLPSYVISDMEMAKMMSYADDCNIYVSAKSLDVLKSKLETLSKRMISYCQKTGLILNNEKTQLLTSTKKNFEVNIGSCLIKAKHEINILGVDYDTNFTTNPYLEKLARDAKTRAALINRLSFGLPPYLLSTFANGLLMGKISAAAPATVPIRLECEDRGSYTITEEINKAIKATARSITRTKLSDKIKSEVTLKKARIRCLNEAAASAMAVLVWKCKQSMNPLGSCLFAEKENRRNTRLAESLNICPPVPGFKTLPSNLMARIWNTVPGLQTATTLGAVKSIVRKWARTIPR